MAFKPADVRRFLTEAFSDDEIEALCFDSFPAVHEDFSQGMSKGDKIQRLLEYCRDHNLVPQLFAALQSARPQPFRQLFGAGPPPLQFDGPVPVVAGAGLSADSLRAYEFTVAQLIATQNQSIRLYLPVALGLILLGVVVIVGVSPLAVSMVAADVKDTARLAVTISGLFIGSLSSLEWREIAHRRERVGALQTVQGLLLMVKTQEDAVDADTRQRIRNLLWDAIEKSAIG